MAIEKKLMSNWYVRDTRRPTLTPHRDFRHPLRVNRSERTRMWFQSNVTRTAHPCHSANEYLWLLLLDITPEVETYQSQVFSMTYVMDDAEHSYTPDTDVLLKSGRRVVVEVKPTEEVTDPSFAKRRPNIDTAARAIGAHFLIITDDYLNAEPRKSNVWNIHQHRHYIPPEDIAYRLGRQFERRDAIPLEELLQLAADPVLMGCYIRALIYQRYLTFDFNFQFGPETLVSLAQMGGRK
ncbi:MAG TPA: hypothetical protein VM659_21655 [Dongiaceae bacterium]|nr:hypothetical protein [Dongiaceae bacterium]